MTASDITPGASCDTPRPAVERPFTHPWHAEVFALVISLHDAGLFSWQDWADMLAHKLATDANAGSLDGGDDYYGAWLAALEALLQGRDVAGLPEIEQMVADWRRAYLGTPHGTPVRLARSGRHDDDYAV